MCTILFLFVYYSIMFTSCLYFVYCVFCVFFDPAFGCYTAINVCEFFRSAWTVDTSLHPVIAACGEILPCLLWGRSYPGLLVIWHSPRTVIHSGCRLMWISSSNTLTRRPVFTNLLRKNNAMMVWISSSPGVVLLVKCMNCEVYDNKPQICLWWFSRLLR